MLRFEGNENLYRKYSSMDVPAPMMKTKEEKEKEKKEKKEKKEEQKREKKEKKEKQKEEKKEKTAEGEEKEKDAGMSPAAGQAHEQADRSEKENCFHFWRHIRDFCTATEISLAGEAVLGGDKQGGNDGGRSGDGGGDEGGIEDTDGHVHEGGAADDAVPTADALGDRRDEGAKQGDENV